MKIIGFAGKKYSGKDTASQTISMFLWYREPTEYTLRIAFADSVKQEVSKALGISVETINKEKEKFRTILQWWGTDWRRNIFDDDYWIKQWQQKLIQINKNINPPIIILVPDIRFKNEIEAVRQEGGKVFYVKSVGKDFPIDTHESENSVIESDCDDTIINDYTDSKYIVDNVFKLIEKYKI